MMDDHNHATPAPKPRRPFFTASAPPAIHPITRTPSIERLQKDDSKAAPHNLDVPDGDKQLKRSPFSSTYLRRILASLYTPATYLASAIHNTAPSPPDDPTEPPLSPHSLALASAAAYPFPAAPAVYSVPFIINDQICVVPYVPLPRPAGYVNRSSNTSRASTPPPPPPPAVSTGGFSPRSPHHSSSPLSPPSPPSSELCALVSPHSLQLGERWLSVLSPSTLSAHFNPHLYQKLLHTPTPYTQHITKDITRTFPTTPLFTHRKTRTMLYNVLAAYSNYDIDIGYSQGMAFLVGFLLLHTMRSSHSDSDSGSGGSGSGSGGVVSVGGDDVEVRVYWAFVALMYCERWTLRSLYFDDCVSLKRLLLLTQRCLDERAELRPLSTQLRGLSLDVTLFVTQWYVTVYSYRFDVAFSQRVWTLFMDGGWRVLLCVALSVMEWLQERVDGLSFEGVMGEVRGMEAVGVEVAERSSAIRLSPEVEKELEACKYSEKRVRSLKM